jgi:hypothetical protein
VPSHACPGAAALGKQLRLDVSVDRHDGMLTVEMAHSAGHPLPSGYVDRRLIVRATYYDPAGAVLSFEDRAFGIFLAGKDGRPAPFFRAVRVTEDRRLLPGRTYALTFKIPEAGKGPAPGRVIVSLLAARTAPELSAVYGEPDLLVLKTAPHMLQGTKSQGD